MNASLPLINDLAALLTEPTQELGSVVHLTYDKAIIATNDTRIRQAGGLPRHCFLLAGLPDENNNFDELLLLSVQRPAQLEAHRESTFLKEQMAITGKIDTDSRSLLNLGVAGFECAIVGTFYKTNDNTLKFGSDRDTLGAHSPFKIYKPQGKALSYIASCAGTSSDEVLQIGNVRYSDTQRFAQAEAPVFINIKDFLGKKTAVFGMTRTGKSNTIKTIVKKAFTYSQTTGNTLGQIIFDPQGEYANANSQDGNSALAEMGTDEQIRIYRIMKETSSPKERHLQLNLFARENAPLTWELMLAELTSGISAGSNYIAPLMSLTFEEPTDPQARRHYARKLLGLYALMAYARLEGTFDRFALSVGKDNVHDVLAMVEEIEERKEKPGEVWIDTARGAKNLFDWAFKYKENLSDSWQKDFESGDLSTFVGQVEALNAGRNGVIASFQKLKVLHNIHSEGDVREKIWQDVKQGRLVVVDLSRGSTRVSTTLSELIVNYLVQESSRNFTANHAPIPFQIVVEEAHNLFRREGAKDDGTDPWVRLSKEAAKYHIGLVYATQEVSSVDPRILSNTSNFLISHLNSKTETRELSKYYAFEEWTEHILRVEAKGFVRLKTESSPYIVPVQIEKFVVN